jgi:hypothetical protein
MFLFLGVDPMNNAKHTPGPWEHDDSTGVGVPLATGTQWFDVLGASEVATAQDYANARLIAAAPDLLEALRGVLDHFDPYATPGCEENEQAYETARDAIRKATGEAA